MPELIYRETTLKKMCEMCYYNTGKDFVCRKCNVYELLEKQPVVESKPVRHGRWIPTEYDSYAGGAPVWDKWECSECCHEHSGEEDTLTAFCPDCGAQMDAIETNDGCKGVDDNDT